MDNSWCITLTTSNANYTNTTDDCWTNTSAASPFSIWTIVQEREKMGQVIH